MKYAYTISRTSRRILACLFILEKIQTISSFHFFALKDTIYILHAKLVSKQNNEGI